MSAIGTKQTSPSALHMSAFDPKRTSAAANHGTLNDARTSGSTSRLSVTDAAKRNFVALVTFAAIKIRDSCEGFTLAPVFLNLDNT